MDRHYPTKTTHFRVIAEGTIFVDLLGCHAGYKVKTKVSSRQSAELIDLMEMTKQYAISGRDDSAC